MSPEITIKYKQIENKSLKALTDFLAHIIGIAFILFSLHYQMMVVTYIYENPLFTGNAMVLIIYILSAAAYIALANMLLYRHFVYAMKDVFVLLVNIILELRNTNYPEQH